MKRMKLWAVLTAMLLFAALGAGCSKDNTTDAGDSGADDQSITAVTDNPVALDDSQNNGTAITVTDMTGREVTLDAPAERVVALTASDCEILYAIGAGHTLIGRGTYCDYPSEVLDAPVVQSGSETNVEQIIALNPQLVLMSKMAQSKEQADELDKAGIKVIVTDAEDFEDVYAAITLIGTVMGKDNEATALAESMKNTFADISAKTAGTGEKGTVYFEVSPLEWGLWTAGSGTFMDELAAVLGLSNAFADVGGWTGISEEQVIERNPDYIVTMAMYNNEGPSPVDEILGRAGWQDLKAVQNKAVLLIDSDEVSRPGPRLANAAETLYSLIYES